MHEAAAGGEASYRFIRNFSSFSNMQRAKTLTISGMIAASMLLAGLAVPMLATSAQQAPSDDFSFEYAKSGGIAGINERIAFDSNSNIIKYFKNILGASERQLSNASVESLKKAISDNGFFDMQGMYPTKESGVADYFSHTLTVTMDGRTHSVSWVDDFASSVPLPDGLGKIVTAIEQAYASASDAGAPFDTRRRVSETVVMQSSSHNAEGHSSHQAAYFLLTNSSHVYNGVVTFTTTSAVDILVYHDITGKTGSAQGVPVHVVNDKSYAVTTLLKNVTSGTVDFVGSGILAHSLGSEPYTVVATVDALRKASTSKPATDNAMSFTVDVEGERFVVQATDKQAIQQLTDNYNGKNNMHVTGKLVRGDGGFNSPWSWHLVPESVGMAEISIEVCDGRPSYVEENLDEWLNTVGESYCPWGSKVVAMN